MAEWEPVFIEGHAPGCLWATPLPTGHPHYWHCDCGFSEKEIEEEDEEGTNAP
jgi:hypothetical protein